MSDEKESDIFLLFYLQRVNVSIDASFSFFGE